MKELKSASIQTREVSKLLKDGLIERIKPGLYRLPEIPSRLEFRETLVDVCRAIPGGVICLLSALEYHQLTTANPSEVYVAIPHSDKPPKIEYPPVKTFFFRERFFKPGIISQKTKAGTIRVYSREKTICDMFRYRMKLGEDVAIESLKNYVRSKGANLALLQEYAVKCQVKQVMTPYIRALVG